MQEQPTSTKRRERIFRICVQIVAVLALVMSLKRDIGYSVHPDRRARPYDFRATYCGEFVTAHHGNPYLAVPLRLCEAAIEKKPNLPLPNQALPATFPPYAQVAFSPLGMLDPLNAQRVFYALSFAALLISIWAISQLSLLSLSFVTIPVIFGLYASASRLGAIATIAFMGIAVTALMYERKKYAWCGAFFCLTMLQPQTGLAIFIALFVKEARMRIPLLAAAAFLGLLCLPLGIEQAHNYLESLSIHSRAEQYQHTQLSLTYALRQFGASEQAASLYGSAAFAVWLVLGVLYVRTRGNGSALDLLVPASIAVLPGSFVQTVYLATALIPAMILVKRDNSLMAFFGLALLTLNYQPFLRPSYDIYIDMSIIGLVVLALAHFPIRTSRWVAPLLIVGSIAFCKLFVHPLPDERLVALQHPEPKYASSEWYAYRVAQDGPNTDRWIQKIPYLLGLCLIITAAWKQPRKLALVSEIEVEKAEFEAPGTSTIVAPQV